jgi:mevalonate kinase
MYCNSSQISEFSTYIRIYILLIQSVLVPLARFWLDTLTPTRIDKTTNDHGKIHSIHLAVVREESSRIAYSIISAPLTSLATTSMEDSSVIQQQGLLSVCASAPGKVILFGEHAVVYGEPAVAAALSDLRIFVQITCTDTGTVRMFLPDLPNPIDYSLRSEKLTVGLDSLQTPPTPECAATIAQLFAPSSSSSDAQQHPDSFTVTALTPLIYLLHHLAPANMLTAGLEIRVRSQDLPVGAGLGSSAAFGVASAAALVLLSLSPTAQTQAIGRPDPASLEQINQYAYYSEILLHGTPSGIDNAVSSHGGAIHFTKQQDSVKMKHLTNLAPLQLLLVYTHVPRSTKQLVAGVRVMHEQYPATRIMLQAMGALAQQFQTWWCSSDTDGEADVVGDVLTMVRTNQHLLSAVGVSHASLDRICAVVAETAGDEAAAKLTGAGGGGCAFVVLRPSKPGNLHALRSKVQRALQAAQHPWKFTCLQSSVGGDGVLWLSPTDFSADNDAAPRRSVVSVCARYAAVAVLVAGTCALAVTSSRRQSTTSTARR